MIVQALREIQEKHGYLPGDALRALSQSIRVPLYRLQEVASFFPHYRLQRPPHVEIAVCRDVVCHLNGAGQLDARMRRAADAATDGSIIVEPVSCLGQCDRAPAATINDRVYRACSDQQWDARLQTALSGQSPPDQPDDTAAPDWSIDPYDAEPRYEAVHQLTRDGGEALLNQLKVADLRGMGGAGFPTHRKWQAVRDVSSDRKYVICNADESEPGTFKDRELLRRAPHLVIEGMIAAGTVTGAPHGYVYIRHEYQDEIASVQAALTQARHLGLLGDAFDIELFVSPGGYICGEETALLEAMEDRRAEPRNKPPYPVTHGLYGKPTVINNVETLAWVPAIALRGGQWYRDQGLGDATGLRLVSVSGHVASPGVYEVPFGLSVRELIARAGGMRPGHHLQAIAPSGPSSGFLPAVAAARDLPHDFAAGYLADGQQTYDIRDLPLDFKSLRTIGSMLGGAMVVIGDRACIVDLALNCTQFFRNESCGKCVPCRLGSQKLVDMLQHMSLGSSGRFEMMPLIDELAETLAQTSICGLGMVAANPITTLLRYFRPTLEAHLQGKCPAGVCALTPSPMTRLSDKA